MSLKNYLLFLFIIWIQDGQCARHPLRQSRRGSHIRNNKNLVRDEFDTSNGVPDKSNSVEFDMPDLKNDKYSLLEENQSIGNYLFPQIFDVAPFSNITANATCGTTFLGTDETFCKLSNPSSCSVCSSVGADKKYSISYAIDNDSTTWWQSPTFERGPQYEYVTIVIDLKQEYYIWSVIIKCANSPRPANWILERSIDGAHYSPWQYFAHTEDECWQKYGLRATSTSGASSDNETLCSTAYSKVKPLEGGQIHANIAKGRPGCVLNCSVINTQELKEFSRTRFLRLRFHKYNIPKDKASSLADPFVQRSLFYSIKKISVSAQCICYGHASRCRHSIEGDASRPQCECSHNTCGNNCERCCPLYNQKPWKEGAVSEVNVCEQCQCHGHAEACRYDAHVDANNASLNIYGEYRGGGVCINCTKHTVGINCERCETGWYRPAGVPANAREPCLRCDCHLIGSTGTCIPSTSRRHAHICECLEGYDGAKCDRCVAGLRNFPDCEKCDCDSRGTMSTEPCEKRCICKENVEGDKCEKCKSGFFELAETNARGCKECYCSGVTKTCSEALGYGIRTLRNMTNWTIVDSTLSVQVSPLWDNEANLSIIYDSDVRGEVNNYYWSAPSQYVGNKLTSYGLVLRVSISWNVQRGDTSGKPVFNPDIIIVGSNGIKIAYGNENYADMDRMMLAVRLSENKWYRVREDSLNSNYTYSALDDSQKIGRKEILSVLADVKFLLLRATFHTDQVDCSLVEVDLEVAVKEENEDDMKAALGIEQCDCPAGYTGLSCELCDYGFIQQRSDNGRLMCTSCDCNGHSPRCDLVTGRCEVCEHNTTGPKCELCKEGFYGNAETGTRADCNVCACPLLNASNNFSPTCVLKDGTLKHYVCDKCPVGYDGDRCERCAEGYFGNPMELGSTCIPCNCSGSSCNTTSGQCLRCGGNTDGWHCEQCKVGYYGNATHKNCSKCNCNSIGSQDTTFCDPITGQCSCRANYVGRTCDKCLDGYGDFKSGCLPCNCDVIGSKNELCDSVSGQCKCKEGVVGKTCNRCRDNYFGFETGSGCRNCNCSIIGSLAAVCDPILGQCVCKKNVTSKNCEQCVEGFYGLGENGCQPCECNEVGSISMFCDAISGQCTCKYGVTGHKCDRCRNNFYGFSKFGCFECESCNKPGHVCDIDSGRCICPFRTEGPYCEHCVLGAWNYTSFTGCQECHCDKQGSINNHCNFITGQCVCRDGYSGEKCDMCAPGYFGFPKCRPCSCNAAGCDPTTCFGDRCLCDSGGQCYCKANTLGKKCDQCKEGTFGLHADNVGGCTACFCFGRSTQCSEAGLTWSHVRLLPDRTLLVHYDTSNNSISNFSSVDIYPVNPQQICYINYAQPDSENGLNVNRNDTGVKLNVTNNLRLIPGFSGNVEIGVNYLFDAPIYWQLPESFLGDKVLSYGGFMEFTVDTEGEKTFLPSAVIGSYPLIQIQGNDKFILEYFPALTASDKHHRVRLHESLWKLKNNPTGHVSRDTLMLTLQNLQHILIRASNSIDFTKAGLKDVSLDMAVKGEEISPQTLSVTHGVELCECPNEYSSTSCQNPSIGYYRYYDNRTTAVSTIIIQVVGEAMPCDCNGFSSVCDINTGTCLNCSKNRGGRQCERCADGYYMNEAVDECQPCPCPHPYNNHAYACYVPPSEDAGEQVVCHCQQGYTGKLCDKCSYEYYGYPRLANGSCQSCNCNPWGMASEECDEETGQCNCKADIIGKECSICAKKNHVLSYKGCIPCEDTCVNLLLEKIEDIVQKFADEMHVMTPKHLEPLLSWLESVNETCYVVETSYSSYETSIVQVSTYGESVEEELNKKVKNSKNKIKNVWKHVHNVNSSVDAFLANVSRLSSTSKVLSDELNVIVDNLKKYIQSKKSHLNLPTLMTEARYLQNKIDEIEVYDQSDKLDRILSICRTAYENVRSHDVSGHGLDLLNQKTQNLEHKVDDLKSITTQTESILNEITEHLTLSKNLLNWITNISMDIDNMTADMYDKIAVSTKLSNEAKQLLFATEPNLQNAIERSHKLKNLIQLVENKEGILFDLNESYRKKYVLPALAHADTLVNHSRYYEGLFVSTKQDADVAVQASRAYTNIVDAIEEAQKTIKDVDDLLHSILHKLKMKTNGVSILEKVYIMEEKSRDLLVMGKLRKEDVENLRSQYDFQLNYLDFVETKLQDVTRNLASISSQLSDMSESNNKMKLVEDTLRKYKSTIEVSDDIYDHIFSIQDNINDELKPKLKSIQSYGEIGLLLTDELKIREVEETTSKTVELLHSTQRVFYERVDYFNRWDSSASDQLESLKDKIEETKHLANGIQLSLSSKSDQELCSRSYLSKYVGPSITNYISLTYAISTHHRDSLLFYLASSTSDDFLAVEMVDRKIRFSWDLGGGPAELTHSLHIQTAGDLQKDQNWYKIDVERISNIGKLSVRPMSTSAGSVLANGSPVTNASVSGWNRFDVSSSDPIWIGGVDKPVTSYVLSKKGGLFGCLSSVAYDNRPIGLWNFGSETPGSCYACIESIEETAREDGSYFFTGDGYATMQGLSSTVYNKYFFSVSFNFKTFDENAILFYAAAVKPEQYISVAIREGRVVFQIGYTTDNVLEIRSSNRYTTGNWTHLEATRYYDRKKKIEKGVLKVNSETKDGFPMPALLSQSHIPDLSAPQYFFGGLSPGFEPRVALPQAFLGCMSDLQVTQETYNPLRGRNWGVQKFCSEKPVTVVGFKGNGYLELASYPLMKNAAFSFIFSTNQQNAFLMLSTTEGFESSELDDGPPDTRQIEERKVNFYSVSLKESRVELLVNDGSGEIRLRSRSDISYSDGQYHALSVIKSGKRLELRMDDVIQAIGFMEQRGSGIVRAAGKVGGFFFGGVPSDLAMNMSSISNTPLVGTIRDAIFDDKLLRFDEPIEFEHALIGRPNSLSLYAESGSLSAPQNTQEANSCYNPIEQGKPVEPNAVQFGNLARSYVYLDYDRHQVFHNKNASIQLMFRTFYENGILLLIPGAEEKQSHYVRLFLYNGTIYVFVKGKKKIEMVCETTYDDGQWHRVNLMRDGKLLFMSVDDLPVQKIVIPKKLNLMNALYIGGYSNEISMFKNSPLNVGSLRGCIKDVIVNDKKEDLVGEKAKQHHVGQCFPRIERGAYFSDAYSIFAENFYVGTRLLVELEFRTSNMQGILLSISEPQGYPSISLELVRGKVVLNGDMGDRRPFKIKLEFSSIYYLCDYSWHHVKVALVNGAFTLHVDDKSKMYSLPDNGHITEASTYSPLYIGGISKTATTDRIENFKGCIRNIIIGERKVKWTDFHKLHNVLVSSCPVQ